MHADHRARLIRALEGGLVVLTAYDAMQLSGDMAALSVQEANFCGRLASMRQVESHYRRIAQTRTVRPKRSDVDIILMVLTKTTRIAKQAASVEIIDEKILSHGFGNSVVRIRWCMHFLSRHRDGEFVHNPQRGTLEETLKRIFERAG